MLNRSADQVDHPSYPDRKYDKNSDHQEATESLTRGQRQNLLNNDTNDNHHPHYSHHRTYTSKSSTENKFSNSPYKYGTSYPQERQIDMIEKSERKLESTTMQNVIMKKQSSLITSETKVSASSNRDHRYASKKSEEIAKTSSGVVKRTKNISSPTEQNPKPPTHETYHIEEML